MKHHVMAVLVCCTALSGCDHVHGFRDEAALAAMPSDDCVRMAIGSVPGVTKVERSPVLFARFDYLGTGDTWIAGVELHTDGKGKMSYVNTGLAMGYSPGKAKMDAKRGIMRAVNAALAERCGIPAPVTETCVGMRC